LQNLVACIEQERNMGVYYAIALSGGLGGILAYAFLIQGKSLQAVFMLFFVVLCSVVAVFFKLTELNENIKKLLEKMI